MSDSFPKPTAETDREAARVKRFLDTMPERAGYCVIVGQLDDDSFLVARSGDGDNARIRELDKLFATKTITITAKRTVASQPGKTFVDKARIPAIPHKTAFGNTTLRGNPDRYLEGYYRDTGENRSNGKPKIQISWQQANAIAPFADFKREREALEKDAAEDPDGPRPVSASELAKTWHYGGTYNCAEPKLLEQASAMGRKVRAWTTFWHGPPAGADEHRDHRAFMGPAGADPGLVFMHPCAKCRTNEKRMMAYVNQGWLRQKDRWDSTASGRVRSFESPI